MYPYIIKAVVTAVVVLIVSELGKRWAFWGAAIASLPIMTITACTIVYLDTGDAVRVAKMSAGVFWLIIPSMPFFLLFALGLRSGVNYWLSLGIALAVTLCCYIAAVWCFRRLGIPVGH